MTLPPGGENHSGVALYVPDKPSAFLVQKSAEPEEHRLYLLQRLPG